MAKNVNWLLTPTRQWPSRFGNFEEWAGLMSPDRASMWDRMMKDYDMRTSGYRMNDPMYSPEVIRSSYQSELYNKFADWLDSKKPREPRWRSEGQYRLPRRLRPKTARMGLYARDMPKGAGADNPFTPGGGPAPLDNPWNWE